ncbi:MAG TPA: DUF2249 domain-containing protein [Verrucomicrobiae bacterium]|nr:DUF2249 domain-containing protein [Verrucomicrobiae bacterium]
MSSKIVTLDVREDIRRGQEPFSIIMETVTGLGPGDQLRLIAPFEPVPLYSVLARSGFSHTARQLDAGDWEVSFNRNISLKASAGSSSAPKAATQHGDAQPPPSAYVEVDARGLEPPQPMVKILEALASLPPRTGISDRTDRRPMHLYAQLEERGFIAETTEQTDGSFLTRIRPR